MWPMRPLARTPRERRWYGVADHIYRVGRRVPWLRRLWFPVWNWAARQGYEAPPLPALRMPPPAPAELERAVGE